MWSDNLMPDQILRHLITTETMTIKKNVNPSLNTNSMCFCLT